MKEFALRVLRFLSPGPAARISLGLTSLVVSMVLAADLVFGLLPNQNDALRQMRARVAENLAVNVAMQMEAGDPRALDRMFQELLARDKDVVSVSVRRDDGRIMAQAGDHTVA